MAINIEEGRIIEYPQDLLKGMRSNIGSTERVQKLNTFMHSLRPRLCLHRARAYTTVYAQTQGEPVEMRVAKAFAKTLEDLPATIYEGELIVGLPTCSAKSAGVCPECSDWLLWNHEIDKLHHRKADPFEVPPEQVQEVKEILSKWQGQSLYSIWAKNCPAEIVAKALGSGWANSGAAVFMNGLHFTPPFELILEKGMCWYEARVKKRLANLDYAKPDDMGKEHFYKAILIVIDAVRKFAEKYANEALALSEVETDPKRKEELVEISQILRRVPYYEARSFHEAIQSIWFIHMLFFVEGTGPSHAMGRFDQYMYPYYKGDIDKGLITSDQTQELIELLFLKISGLLALVDSRTAESAPGYNLAETICIGGIDNSGRDASNELSYHIMEAAKTVRTTQPDIILLCHPRETPYKLKMKAAELVTLGLGHPKFFSTETIKHQLMEAGYTLEEAELGWIQGCSEPYGPGCKQYGHNSVVMANLALAVECVLFNGRKRMPKQPMSRELIGIETGDCRKFKSFDEFMAAVKAQLAAQIKDAHIAGSYAQLTQRDYFPVLLQSMFSESCIDRGLWAGAGGAEIYFIPGISFQGGIGTIADSLAVIKKLVYEEKKITMDERIKAIDANYEGYEQVRQMFINEAPKFGNDIDYVDDMAKEIWQFSNGEVRKYHGPLGNKSYPCMATVVSYLTGGLQTWATPDGRKAGDPLSNNVGPTEQRDVNGPVAHINSVTKLGIDRQFGTVHNMYLVNINNEEKTHKMIDLIDLYHNRGGHHLQINCQDRRVFLDAQKHPEKYPTLLVRVAGYIAYFVELPESVQNDVIERTPLQA
jgi:pyruvate formate-lyase/glycerol dehydratase family glycyl radical enzyme